MIIVTPYLVRPVSGQIALPTDGYRAADRRRSACSRARPSRPGPPGRSLLRRPPPAIGGAARRRSAGVQAVIRRSIRKDADDALRRLANSAVASGGALPAAPQARPADRQARRRSGQRAGRHPLGLCVRPRAPDGTLRRRKQPSRRLVPRPRASATATSSTSTARLFRGARAQVAGIAGNYGMLVSPGAPVTAGAVAPGSVRVVVSRDGASVPDCPNWERPSQPNYNNRDAAQLRLRRELPTSPRWSPIPRTWSTAAKAAASVTPRPPARAINIYRTTPPTGTSGLKDVNTKSGGSK